MREDEEVMLGGNWSQKVFSPVNRTTNLMLAPSKLQPSFVYVDWPDARTITWDVC